MALPQPDWNEIWKCQFERSRDLQRKENILDYDVREHALHYLKKAPKERTERILQSLPCKTPDSDDFRVLDIGAGPGRLAIPLSAKVAHITAVEPGKGMLQVLKERITEHKIQNITTIGKRWEDIDIAKDLSGPYDLVIASHSLEMPDLKKAIKKMCMASRRWIYLIWEAGIPRKEQRMIDLWPALYGRTYYPGPKADILYHLLYDMGIFPNVKMHCFDSADTYPDMEAAVIAIRRSVPTSTPNQEKILREYLRTTLEISENNCIFREREYRATIWWETSEIDSTVKTQKL